MAASQTTYPTASDQIGSTPLIDLTKLLSDDGKNANGVPVRVLGKAEYTNPGLSHKDRIVTNILDMAEERGDLKRGQAMTLVAASSGNTGASVAMIGAMRGYKVVIITNRKCSKEKCDAIRMFGAELRIAEPGQDYMKMELELAKENPSWFAINQYESQDNPAAHYKTTAPEIYEQTQGTITHFVMAASTGGTVTGVGKYLKERNPKIQVVLIDPVGSVLKGFVDTKEVNLEEKKPFLVEGVGKGSVPGAMDAQYIDRAIRGTDADAFSMCRKLARRQGLTVGGSSGLNVHGALVVANEVTEPAVIVTLLCDSGIKYLSKIFNDDWLAENNISVQDA